MNHYQVPGRGRKIQSRNTVCQKGPDALLAKIEYDGILGNLQGLMCKKCQITYRYFMFG